MTKTELIQMIEDSNQEILNTQKRLKKQKKYMVSLINIAVDRKDFNFNDLTRLMNLLTL